MRDQLFRTETIGDVCYVTDGAHAKVARCSNGVRYLTSRNIGHGELLLDKVDYIAERDYARLFSDSSKAHRKLKPGDVLMGIIGTFGNAYLYREDDHFGVSSAVAIVRPDQNSIVPTFLYYVVTSEAFRSAHSAYKAGSVQGYTNIPTIKRLPLPVPPLTHQQKIVSILGALDRRIALSKKMSKTLEAMARAIFKSWFVDFDPVRAKAEGCEPEGMDVANAALFPSEFQDSELGPIPKGWGVGRFGESVVILKTALDPAEHPSETFELFSLPGFDEGRRPLFLAGSEIKSNKTVVVPGSVLLSKLNPSIERVWFPSPSSNYRSLCSTEFLVLQGEAPVSSAFVYCMCREDGFRQVLQSLTTGTSNSHQRVRVPDLRETSVVQIPAAIHSAFTLICDPLLQRVNHNIEQAHNLSAIRDTLLPRLISGKLRVPDAEAMLAEVV